MLIQQKVAYQPNNDTIEAIVKIKNPIGWDEAKNCSHQEVVLSRCEYH